jgi:hypothetical protein
MLLRSISIDFDSYYDMIADIMTLIKTKN